MTRTEYSPERQAFSDKAHEVARAQFYNDLFNASDDNLLFIRTNLNDGTDKGKFFDGEMAIDWEVKINIPDSKYNACFTRTIQERFREPEFQHYQDITLTEYNHASGNPAELYKLCCGLFIYGYFDKIKNTILQAIVVNTELLIHNICTGDLDVTFKPNPRTNQTFACIGFDKLREIGGLVLREYPTGYNHQRKLPRNHATDSLWNY